MAAQEAELAEAAEAAEAERAEQAATLEAAAEAAAKAAEGDADARVEAVQAQVKVSGSWEPRQGIPMPTPQRSLQGFDELWCPCLPTPSAARSLRAARLQPPTRPPR